MDFKTKLAFALVTVSLLSMTALGVFTYFWAEDTFVEESRRHLEAAADRRELEVRYLVGRWQDEVRSLAEDVAAGWPGSSTEAAPPVEITRHVRSVQSDAARHPRSDLIGVALFDVAGEPILAEGSNEPVAPPDPISSSSSSAAAESESVPVRLAGVRALTDGRAAFRFHAPIVVDGAPVAQLEVSLASRILDRILEPASDFGESGRTTLVIPTPEDGSDVGGGGNGYDLLGSGESVATLSPAIEAALRDGEERAFDASEVGATPEIFAVTRLVEGTGIALVTQVDAAEARAHASQLLYRMRRLAISLAAFAILGGTLFGLYLAGPIARLVEDVDRIRHGELGLRLEVKGEDEVAFLAQSLNEFMDQLNRSSDLFRVGDLPILVVCGDSKQRGLLADLLDSWNMKPIVAEDAESARDTLEKAKRENIAPQLLLIDETASGLVSAEAIKGLRNAISSDVPTVYLSSDPDRLDGVMRESAGLGCVLPNPVIASHLMEAILDEMGVSADGLVNTPDLLLAKARPRAILLADDSPLIQRVMVGLLENWGHAVTVADNGRVAVEHYRKTRFDLVLMDVEMPEMNGLEAARAIRDIDRERGLRTPMIALTAETRSGDRERCVEAGMDDYLSKPADPKALYALIERFSADAGSQQET